MLVTTDLDHRNHTRAMVVTALTGIVIVGFAWLEPSVAILLFFTPVIYWLIRRQVKRRQKVVQAPFSDRWKEMLRSHVAFYRTLNSEGQRRYEMMVQIFLDEVTITGVKTDVDDLTRLLVASSAVIPVFGFDDWEYSRLGEVLIFPGRFDDGFQMGEGNDANILGMVGVGHLSGVMILSKPDLIAGFVNPDDKRNVGIHEFAHLVDKADGSVDGVPLTVSGKVVDPWIQWVGKELKESRRSDHIDDYAFTNEAEYFAVLSEYFFEAPDTLAKKAPAVYQMMQSMYRQDTQTLLSRAAALRPKRVGRNAPCPCGSGEKYKRCCRRRG